ncbi:MAG: carbohydrate ABC transporter permease [Actinobacteria bacterium]|nr:carbohydrate ABC transporter permease [Actinomycetota bacterium]
MTLLAEPTSTAPAQRTVADRRAARRRKRVSPFTYVILVLMCFISIFPFYWMFVVASNGSEEISKIPPSLVPGSNFDNVVQQINDAVPFWRAIANTLIVSSVIALSNVFFSALAGFALAKLRVPAKRQMLLFIIGTMMLPAQLGIIFMYVVMSWLNWVNDFKALVVPALVGAFGVFWMRQIIDSQLPNELLEAARIDGASIFRIFRSIVVPAIRPAAFVLGLFSFLGTWNDFLWPSLVLNDPERFTVQVAITQLNSSYTVDYAANMGAALLGTAPLLVLFIFVGRRLVAGVMDGAVKG